MRSFLGLWLAALLAAAGLGCSVGSGTRDTGVRADSPAHDVGRDSPAVACTMDSMCNDGFDCTIDVCAAGNVCDHTPIDAMCPSGQHCAVGAGCEAGCTVNADCDDGVFCNGTEQCLDHTCFHDMDRNCDDGMSCTTEVCDTTSDTCVYTIICDGGVVPRDMGPICTPFTAPDDFNGTYLVTPAQSQGCGTTMYTLGTITITATGSTISISGLRVDGTNVTLSGTSTGNSFTATYSDSCGPYTLTGNFDACRESFDGHWTAAIEGCGCTHMDATVTGLRR